MNVHVRRGELDLEELLASPDAGLQPVGAAQAPAQNGSEVALASGGADGPADGKVEHNRGNGGNLLVDVPGSRTIDG